MLYNISCKGNGYFEYYTSLQPECSILFEFDFEFDFEFEFEFFLTLFNINISL